MNGQNLMEALSFVDEEYIQQAEAARPRRLQWKPALAAAACLAVVLTGARILMPTQKDSAAGIALYAAEQKEELILDAAPRLTTASTLLCMTVHIEAVEGDGALCTVTDPGTSVYETGIQLRILLPEDARCTTGDYLVWFTPGGTDTVTAVELTPAEE